MSNEILIVDDTVSVRMLIKVLLEPNGYKLKEAEDGKEALTILKNYRPDIVLLDVLMPEMDGIECCQHIKSNPATKDIPVIMVSTKGVEQKKAAYAAGCDGYLTKPIRKVELLSVIRYHLKTKKDLPE